MKNKQIGLLLAALIQSGAALATPVSIGFSGTINNDPYGTGWQSFTGQYTYDSAWSDLNPGPESGTYQGSGINYWMEVTVDGINNFNLSGSIISLSILNNIIGIGDAYFASSDDGAGTSIMLGLFDSTQSLFSSDALPTDAPQLGSFDWNTFSLYTPEIELGGLIDSITCMTGCIADEPGSGIPDGSGIPGSGTSDSISVPEPGSIVLLSLGIAIMFSGINRRRNTVLTMASHYQPIH